MLIYSHSTPEILIASFRTKEQAKNSGFCNLIDDNLPDDVSTLKGDDLIIKEGTNTINLDAALAIAFNNIRGIGSAMQFGKILIANGPNVDTRTLKYYVNRIKNGPFGYEIVQKFNVHFDFINGMRTNSIPFQSELGSRQSNPVGPEYEGFDGTGAEPGKELILSTNDQDIDTDFIDTIKKQSKNCLTAPCNYFNYAGSYGFLANATQTQNTTTNSKQDITNNGGLGINDQETFTRIPPIFQKAATKLNQLTTTGVNKFVTSFPGANSAVKSLSGGNVMAPDTTTSNAYSKAQSDVLGKLANSLGDCYRLNDYRKRYNPFSYYEDGGPNGEQAAAPGISGMPVGYKIQKNDSLNAELSGGVGSFDTYNTWYCPGGGTTNKEKALEGGVLDRRGRPAYTLEAYLAGQAPYVTVAMDSATLPYGTLLYNDSFKSSDGKYIPFRVTDTGSAFIGKGLQKMDIATSSLQKARTGPNFNGKWYIAGGNHTQLNPTETGVSQQPNPNFCIGMIDNQNHVLYQANTVGRTPGVEGSTTVAPVPGAPPVPSGVTDLAAYIDSFQFKYYKGSEIVSILSNVRQGIKNSIPTQSIWGNIIPTLRVLDQLSTYTGKKYKIYSSYRSPSYNAAVGGEKASLHMKFMAIDFSGGSKERDILYNFRNQGVFSGGVGYYGSQGFVHIDTRGTNATWSG